MPSVRRKDKGMYVELPPDLLTAFKDLTQTTRRTLREEIIHAMCRHLESPPQVVYLMDVPKLKPATVEIESPPQPAPRRGPGRPRRRPYPNCDESISREEVE